ncbi:hypothetical protein H0H87_000891 [Tephrocybe sp. NHM501043]|nr:hypothetical protein H0H87_000891 [Tephrocybe sp. NHM501043]
MAKTTELIDERVSVNQCKKAVDALYAHETKKAKELQETELLPGKEQNIWINVTVKKIPSGHKFKPYKIPIAHPLIDPRTTSICLITKDPQREYKDLLEAHNIKFISRVVGIEKLKGKFKPFEARRILLKENGLFLADERIVPLLPKLLGVKWFEAKKQPIPVCLKRKDLMGELERAVSSTYMNQNQGTCTSVKVATLSHTPKQILANLKLALPAITKNIVGGWANIQALHIKTNSSVSLPIWSCTLDETESGRWTAGAEASKSRFGGEDGDESDSSSDVGTKEVVAEKAGDNIIGKGKKRVQEEEQAQKPKKKAKGLTGEAVTEPAALTGRSSTPTSTPGSKLKPAHASPVESKPKSKKRKSELPIDTSSAPTPTKKTSKKSDASEDPAALLTEKAGLKKKDSIPKVLLSLAPSAASAVVTQDKPRKSKKSAKPMSDAPDPSALTTDELKQKRSGAPGEKKKVKVNTAGAKSAKDRILGKKVAQ